MDWQTFHLFSFRTLSLAGWEFGSASHADNYPSTFSGTSVSHWSHRSRHPAWQWEKCGWCPLSSGSEIVRWLTQGSICFIFVYYFYTLFYLLKSKWPQFKKKKSVPPLSIYLSLYRWEKWSLLLLVTGYSIWGTGTLILLNWSHYCWAASVMKFQK